MEEIKKALNSLLFLWIKNKEILLYSMPVILSSIYKQILSKELQRKTE